MKGCDFVKKAVSCKAKSHPLVYKNSWMTAAILLVLTVISTRMVCSLYARYTISDTGRESAGTAAAAGLALEEISVELYSDIADMVSADTVYTFGSGTADGMEYLVVPGMDIPKDPYISVDGKNQTPCYLYIEVIQEHVPETVSFALEEDWILLADVPGRFGGDVYTYRTIIGPKEKHERIGIIEDQKLYVSQSYSAGDPFRIAFRGYMIQAADGYTASQLFRNHMKEGV